MPARNACEKKATNLLKIELKKRGITSAGLITALEGIGVLQSEANLRNKLSRGKFTGAFMRQCLEVVEAQKLELV